MSKIKTSLARVLVRPPTRPSGSAMEVRRMFGDKARLSRLNPPPRQYTRIINWGNPFSLVLRSTDTVVYNQPSSVAIAINKLASFKTWTDWNKECDESEKVDIPEYSTTEPGPDSGLWFARSGLTLSGGRGITVVRDGVPSVSGANLYVKYIPKLVEYRVHVVAGKVIFIQQKKRVRDAEQTADEKLIRNHDNGWVFCLVNDVDYKVERVAINAVQALGLTFGAVDIVVHKNTGVPYVLECNTAPGLSSPTLIEAYKKAFFELTEVSYT